MRCLYPRTVAFADDGKTIVWSKKNHSPEYAKFQLPCSKCLECRLEYARQWAVRCVHEAKMHAENSFITLTYSEENLKSTKLIYRDFQLFMKRLRRAEPHKQISVFVTGEYGEKTKRPHWHAIIFNWQPTDLVKKYQNDRGDQVYSSATLDRLWGHGISEVGSVTFESAGYVARYAAKKLIHGKDQEHDYHPISKKSSKRAIGRTWLETYYKDLSYGYVIMENGMKVSIPRYYVKWMKENLTTGQWEDYVTKALDIQTEYATRSQHEEEKVREINMSRPMGKGAQVKKSEVKKQLIKQKFKILQSHLKDN
nr:MAG: replication initiator protein [Microvirus sp.]QJB19703.1 MAG: replication initiator protein [Microvirus sp.]